MRIAYPIGLVLCLLACTQEAAPPGRVLVVGIDGATLRVARPMLEAGGLPNLAAIASAGVFGPLRAHAPISSPRIWTSMATGKRPERHGIVGFAHDTPDGATRLYLSSDRKVPALWNIASAAGFKVGVVNWWNTYPVERVDGILVSDHLLSLDVQGRSKMTGADTSVSGPVAFPMEWNERSAALLEDDTPLVDVPDPFGEVARFPGWLRPPRLSLRYQNDADVVRIALAIEREARPDVMLVFLPGIDRVSHVAWAALEPPEAYKMPPAFTPEQREATANALRGYYTYTDALIGRLLERYGPDDLVMVVSDHGFEAGTGLGFLTGGHYSNRSINGVIFARGAGVGVPSKRRPISVDDVAPTILAWLGLPVGADMDGRPASFLGEHDWPTVATHDGLAVERLAEAPSGAEEAILEQLEALGYLEDGGSDAED